VNRTVPLFGDALPRTFEIGVVEVQQLPYGGAPGMRGRRRFGHKAVIRHPLHSMLQLFRTRNIRIRTFQDGAAVNQDTPQYIDTIHKFLALHRYLRRYSRRIRAEGIGGRKVSALRYLLETGPRTIGQLSDYHYISDSSASEMVAELVRLGYVTRTRSESDQRFVLVDLTEAGREFAQDAPLGGIPLLRERLRALPPERLALINQALTDLNQLLEIGDDS